MFVFVCAHVSAGTVLTLRGSSYISYRVYDWKDRVHSSVNRISFFFKVSDKRAFWHQQPDNGRVLYKWNATLEGGVKHPVRLSFQHLWLSFVFIEHCMSYKLGNKFHRSSCYKEHLCFVPDIFWWFSSFLCKWRAIPTSLHCSFLTEWHSSCGGRLWGWCGVNNYRAAPDFQSLEQLHDCSPSQQDNCASEWWVKRATPAWPKLLSVHWPRDIHRGWTWTTEEKRLNLSMDYFLNTVLL